MKDLLDSFIAFNINGLNYLRYMLTQNWSLAVILLSSVITTIIYLREEVVLTTREEQTIL